MVNINLALCASRHVFPDTVSGSIFRETIPAGMITSPERLEDYASARISEACAPFCPMVYTGRTCYDFDHFGEDEMVLDLSNVHLTIYVTGLSVALVAALNACRFGGVGAVTLMHYDRASGEYYPQEVR